MKCFNHSCSDAAATCQQCGKGLCHACAARFDMPFCLPCLLSHNQSVTREMSAGLLMTAVVFMTATWFLSTLKDSHGQTIGLGKAATLGLLLAFTYWGWRFLTQHLPRLVAGTGFMWIVYLLVKFLLAYFIGLIVGPYQIFKMLKEIGIVRKLRRQIASGEV
jgi:hypothetical protein